MSPPVIGIAVYTVAAYFGLTAVGLFGQVLVAGHRGPKAVLSVLFIVAVAVTAVLCAAAGDLTGGRS